MAIGSKRGLRSILSRKSYSHLKDDHDFKAAAIPQATAPTLEEKPVTVSLHTSITEEAELECVNGVDRIIVCTTSSNDEEKESEDLRQSNVSIGLVRDTSLMSDLVASRLALASKRSFTPGKNETSYPFSEEKTDDVLLGVPVAAAEPTPEPESCSSVKTMVTTSKERVIAAFQKTQTKTSALFEAYISSTKDNMTSMEDGSQAAIVERLPLSPILEQASEKLETVVMQVGEETQEFFLDHWNMLQNLIRSRKEKKAKSSLDNVKAENPSPSTSIEVQMQDPAITTTV